jgi:protease IV
MRFLGNVLAVIVGLVLFSIISTFLFLGLIAAMSFGEDEVTVKENSVLHINLENRVIVEKVDEDDSGFSFLSEIRGSANVGLINLRDAIQAAKENDNIKGIYLQAGVFSAGQATIQELREELKDFKSSGKFIVSYSEIYSEQGYYLSSAADEVYLNPIGGLEFNGFAAEIFFLKGMFEKLEIEPEIFRVGEFKSAVEPFMLSKMSDESRLQTESYLRELNQFLIQQVAESREIPIEQAQEINNKMLVRSNKDALTYKLVDGLWYEDQVKNLIKEKLGLKEDDKISSINVTGMNKSKKEKNKLSKNRIAVIVAEGEIVSGSADGYISSEKFAKEIRKAKDDKDIKAIVLRINSPGGSIIASEVLWREIEEAKKLKPVIASMGEVAASGGYYLAAPADTIVAQANTITGSIGIFGLWFNAKGLLNNKMGITTDVAKTGEFSDFMSFSRKMSDIEKSIMQANVEEGYDVFIDKVVKGRNMSKNNVLEIASGRVWSGTQAKERGLVDVLGGLNDAIKIAATKADLGEDFRLVYFPIEKPFFEKILDDLKNEVKVHFTEQQLKSLYPYYLQLERLNRYEGIMVRMPFDVQIQ